MISIKEKLKEDLKVSIKSGNSLKKNLIKVILTEISIEEKRGKIGYFLNDDGVISCIKKMKKSLETIKNAMESSGKPIEKYVLEEIEILDSYLPKQMATEEIEKIISEIMRSIQNPSIKDMGKIISEFNSKYPSKADGKILSQIVKNILLKV